MFNVSYSMQHSISPYITMSAQPSTLAQQNWSLSTSSTETPVKSDANTIGIEELSGYEFLTPKKLATKVNHLNKE